MRFSKDVLLAKIKNTPSCVHYTGKPLEGLTVLVPDDIDNTIVHVYVPGTGFLDLHYMGSMFIDAYPVYVKNMLKGSDIENPRVVVGDFAILAAFSQNTIGE